MSSKSMERKAGRKQKRCQNMITNETQIQCNDQPKQNLVVCNAGLSTGLKNDVLLLEAMQFGSVLQIILLPGKSYSFIKCKSVQDSVSIYNGMNAKSTLGQNGSVLYLLYCDDVPENVSPWDREHPSGLIIIEDFVTELEEERLLKRANDDLSASDAPHGSMKHRHVFHYGYEFKYDINNVDATRPLLEKPIPDECNELWPRLKSKMPTLLFQIPNQVTVNKYEPGAGIPPHCDTHSAFQDPIFSLSLNAGIVMEFRRLSDGSHVSVWLPRRSLLIMSKESRYGWTHGITPRKTDIIPVNDGLTVIERKLRVSFTFRSLKFNGCCCGFSALCDTYKKSQRTADENVEKLVIPSELELRNVHKVYDEIANHFSETRHSPWPKVGQFIESFTQGSILFDIGCGNGKYLSLNASTLKIGCDRSHGLLNVCYERGFNIFQCDCLYLPVRSNCADGCISIAVIHHLVTKERRLQAISEMSRILVAGGRGLIYVWSKNQAKGTKSSYLRQNKRNNRSDSDTSADLGELKFFDGLPIHTNRTQFSHSDMLVPWTRKDESSENQETFLRFYHVFEEDELTELCEKVSDIEVIERYYDQGNWCVIFQKK
ncbi:Alkylated DNA repair protein alkB like 8 [Pseudolycoriella hygida]|uniref:Alkylated DNA repair protein alkB like 8 n=1 Tax=Pseudolycoriella hygida TaxID=35572 RepID=A0A9Q0MLI7_9DIPT|nr:Alkylated DNA repair protein alkB like 8 [Pseudolycoriella hygida]